ncbi:DNA internalization-related competence protein ComEC/Rec2 [Ectothiorhodospiraceae bacterium BW-2]|nr:DNA internalization-related competence protein ComEC/Rec2 [Ectothiorhodospiraceae bacterium BW-2]
MITAALFLVGVLLGHSLPWWPKLDPRWWLTELGLLLLLWLGLTLSQRCRFGRYGVMLLLGLGWVGWHISLQLTQQLPPQWLGETVIIEGRVDSLVEDHGYRQRWIVALESIEQNSWQGRIRLSWYAREGEVGPQVRANERWRMAVRLKPPRGMANPGGFDYERWLWQQGVVATGYVRDREFTPQRLAAAEAGSLLAFRERLLQRLQAVMPSSESAALLPALALGERSAMSDSQWQLLIATGTSHLLAISGLHIGAVATSVIVLVSWLWRLSPHWLTPPLAPRRLALILGALAAISYAALAGFSIPTQRALFMLLLVALAWWWQRPLLKRHWLTVTAVGLVIIDPYAPLSVGYWLSLTAVALILLALKQRYRRYQRRAAPLVNPLLAMVRLQWWLFWGMVPLLLLLFGQLSLLAPLANSFAVPWVTLLIVPPLLLALLLLLIGGEGLAAWLLLWSDRQLEWLLQTLRGLAQWLEPWQHGALPWPLLLLSLIGVVWLLLPRGWPARWLGALLLLPLLSYTPSRPDYGSATVTVLDVGQGLAVVVETERHLLIYDTGPRFRSGFNSGSAIILPYLQWRGHQRVDRLILSHGDSDHVGGAAALLQQLPVAEVVGSDDVRGLGHNVRRCLAKEQWHYDGVAFTILAPQREDDRLSENNRSCVLLIEAAGGERGLLTGDIEQQMEQRLVERYGERLQANMMLAPHHGSRTSSTTDFIEQVRPEWVVFPSGFRNRYGFPHADVVQRYRAVGSQMVVTAESGAVTFCLGAHCPDSKPERYRQQQPRYWRRE